MTYYEFINFIESKVTFPFSLSVKARKQFGFYYYKYSMEFIKECIEIGVRRYFRYDANKLPTQESVNEFLNKIGGILHNRNTMPVYQTIDYIQNLGRKRHMGWNNIIARRILDGYIRVLLKKWDYEKINMELRDHVVMITKESRDWSEWVAKMTDIIGEIAVEYWPNI